VLAATAPGEAEAAALAAQLRVPRLRPDTDPVSLPPGQLLLILDGDDAVLQPTGPGSTGPVTLAFSDPALVQRRRAGHNELIGRAVGWSAARPPTVLDGTAGYGRDAFVLADLGCRVELCEREPVMAALLDRAIARALASEDPWLSAVASRMLLREHDLRQVASAALEGVDVIYLDPMFCHPRKTAPGKGMQVLQLLTDARAGEQHDAAELLAWALQQPVRRVVVKRPRKAPPLSGRRPSHDLRGRSVRFDVYPGPAQGPK
jgi:16S rRNA (guanine1516-N2)-methyltransferase